jgi:DNA-binding MarR family transcriptional regulator
MPHEWFGLTGRTVRFVRLIVKYVMYDFYCCRTFCELNKITRPDVARLSKEQKLQEQQELTDAGKWYRDRDEWVRHVIGRPYLTDAQRLIATFIAMHINRSENHTKHQQTTIAKDLNLSVVTVKKATKRLIEESLIERTQVRRGQRNRAVNQYRLIFPWT